LFLAVPCAAGPSLHRDDEDRQREYRQYLKHSLRIVPPHYTIAMVKDAYYQAAHYNLKYKSGALLNRITANDLRGIRPADVEFIWLVEQSGSINTRATSPASI
jgi:hypothetical protein